MEENTKTKEYETGDPIYLTDIPKSRSHVQIPRATVYFFVPPLPFGAPILAGLSSSPQRRA